MHNGRHVVFMIGSRLGDHDTKYISISSPHGFLCSVDRRAGLSRVTSMVVRRVCRISAESCKLPSGPRGVVLIEFAGAKERGEGGV
jgi:hypothetical protein